MTWQLSAGDGITCMCLRSSGHQSSLCTCLCRPSLCGPPCHSSGCTHRLTYTCNALKSLSVSIYRGDFCLRCLSLLSLVMLTKVVMLLQSRFIVHSEVERRGTLHAILSAQLLYHSDNMLQYSRGPWTILLDKSPAKWLKQKHIRFLRNTFMRKCDCKT